MLKLQREKMISPQTLRNFAKLCILLIVLQLGVVLLGKLDTDMKTKYAEDNSIEVDLVTEGNEYKNIIGICISIFLIWVWCVSLNLRNCINRNQSIIYAEVQDKSRSDGQVSRHQTKKNLNAALKQTNLFENYDNNFDQFWYEQREQLY